MNKKLILVFTLLFFVIGLSGFIGWAFYTPPKSNHRATVADSSISSANNRCSEIAKLTEVELRKQPSGDKTKLAVFLTGDPQTANEPRELGNFDVPVQTKLTESNSVITDNQSKILAEVKSRCEQFSPASVSSIFLAFKRTVEHLRSLGCDDLSKCEILAQTDLEENADPQIKAAISGTSVNPKNLPAPINNQGLAIKICGVSQTKGIVVNQKGGKTHLTQNRNTARADLIQEVWKKLFTQPELITFAPYCSER